MLLGIRKKVMTMAEYIKKEDIEQKIQDGLNNLVLGHDAIEVLGMIYEIPAADVAPVRHARWVDNHCTACGMMPMGDEMWKHLDLEPPLFERFMDYCPSCGCRMDG